MPNFTAEMIENKKTARASEELLEIATAKGKAMSIPSCIQETFKS